MQHQDERREERRDTHQRIEYTSPIWRVLAIALAAGSVVALGFWAQNIGHADDFATIIVITVVFSVGYWADKRPDRMRLRLGPFSKIAEAVRESRGDLRKWVYEKPLRVGVGLAVLYGVAIVAAKSAVVALMTGLYSWYLAVAVGAAVAAVAAAPHLFTQARDWIAGPQDEPAEEPELPEEESAEN